MNVNLSCFLLYSEIMQWPTCGSGLEAEQLNAATRFPMRFVGYLSLKIGIMTDRYVHTCSQFSLQNVIQTLSCNSYLSQHLILLVVQSY